MPLGWKEIRDRSLAFSSEWKDGASERAEVPLAYRLFLSILFATCAVTASAATARLTANYPTASWQCAAVDPEAAVALPPDAALSAVVNRFMGLYSTRLLGLVQARDRLFLLISGGIASRTGLRADAANVGPSDREFVTQQHVFNSVPRASTTPEGGRSAASPAGFICLVEAAAGRHGLVRTERREIILAAGRSVSLVDPSDPSITVEIRAADHSPMNLREIAALSGRLGIYAGLMRQRGQPDANIAVQGDAGRIVFKSVPEVGPSAASRGGINLTVSDAVTAKPAAAGEAAVVESSASVPPAGEDKPAVAGATARIPAVAETPSTEASPQETVPVAAARGPAVEPARPEPRPERIAAARPIPAAPVTRSPATEADRARSDDGSYANALRKLVERQGMRGVRSISELTYVHPAVDALRASLR